MILRTSGRTVTLCRLLHRAGRLALAAFFVYAAVAKLVHPADFVRNLSDFGLVPDGLVVPVAWTVIVAELLAGLALAVSLRGSLAFLSLLIAVFLGVLGYGIAVGLDIDCGCLGPGYHVGLRTQWLIDVGLLILCFLIYWSGKQCGAQSVGLMACVRRRNV